MMYKGKNYLLDEYYEVRMKEAGFCGNDLPQIGGNYRSETEFNIIAEYESSCCFNLKEIDFIEDLGYKVEDFTGKKLYEVALESSNTRDVICSTNDLREALECYEAYSDVWGGYEDSNGFVWDVSFDEFDAE